MRKYYNDSLARPRLCVCMEVFLVSAFTIFNKKASQPSSCKVLNCLVLARLLPTRGHPLSSCKEGTRISKTSALQRVGGEVRNYMCVYVCDVWEHMCMHLHGVTSGL